jgi:transcription antitermination factor NusG
MKRRIANWYALYTKCHHERRVAKILTFESFNVFFPTRKVLSRRRDRRKILEMPLLPNYLFVHSPSEYLGRVLTIPGVAYILGSNGTVTPVPDDEVASLRILVDSEAGVAPYPYLRAGERIVIKEGPFKGVTGVLLRVDVCHWKLVVPIHLMNRSVAVTVPYDHAERSL